MKTIRSEILQPYMKMVIYGATITVLAVSRVLLAAISFLIYVRDRGNEAETIV